MRLKKKEEKKMDIRFEGKRPYSALKRFLVRMLPACCIHFLYSSSSQFKITKVFLGAGFGGFFGIGIQYLGPHNCYPIFSTVVNSLLVNELSLSEQQKIQLLYCITGIFAFGCALFSNFRCSMIMTLPNIFCEEGHAYLLVLVMGSIYAGPITNLEKNVEEVIRSIGCSVELQINHTKLMWKILINPIKKIAEDLVSAGKEIKNDTSVLNLALEEMNDELNNMDGMDKKEYKKRLKLEKTENNTMWSIQNKFNLKTVLRCEYIAEKGIEKCKDWFDQKHDECMSTIAVPLINFLLCLPMKFKVFCFILRLSTKWCQDNVPVDSNFGLLYDTVNKTIYKMHKGFKSEITVKKQQQDMFLGFNTSKLLITDEIMENVDNKRVVFEKVMSVLRILMRFAFIYFFISAFIYCNKYNRDIQFDNMYITTYFKQIDARRRKKKKRHLLPLRKGEYESFVFPLKIKIQGPEWTIFVVLHEMRTLFGDLRRDLGAMEKRVVTLEEHQETLAEEARSNSSSIQDHEAKLHTLSDKLEDLENRTRRNNLRIRGVSESIFPPAIEGYLQALLRVIKGDQSAEEVQIERAHRALRPRPPPRAPPRDIIVKFLKYKDKEDLLRKATEKHLILHAGEEIQLFTDLSPATLQKRRELSHITSTLKKHGVPYRWGFPVSLISTFKNRTAIFRPGSDPIVFYKELSLPINSDEEEVPGPPWARQKTTGLYFHKSQKPSKCPTSLTHETQTIKQILHIIPIIFLLVISIFIDFILYRLFEIIRKHSFISYQFTSGHKLEILVGGDGFLANLLRRTVRFLNTSSEATHYSTNVVTAAFSAFPALGNRKRKSKHLPDTKVSDFRTELATLAQMSDEENSSVDSEECLPNIRKMSERDYFDSFLPTAIFLMLTFGQVYISRLRRIICSFFNPKREKRRILFLYNDLLRKRETYADIKRKIIMHRAKINTLLARSLMATIYRHFKFLHKFIRRRCAVCNEAEQKDSYVCRTPDCGTVYCRQCWRDMNKFCFACEPYEDFTSADDTEEEL
ncbi:E3 ubiquitin-protein ligase DCST1 [Bombina bombina]|uniref:E3 ubiquitin-protein ligase DCST1 n=1 Tax=Bombina bombina TaxID=8345 RepID=UPI00235ADD95|nr:E3 ubiquitin-protein ligase DCST1 [Bombina bombina]